MPNFTQLNNVEHADLRVRTERGTEFGDNVMSAPVFPHEFRNLQGHYPIVFMKEPESGKFRPIALFSFEEGQNLFLTEDGWDARYIPLSMRMQPFVIGLNNRDGGAPSLEVHVDLDHPRVKQEGGEPVFLAQGGHTDFLKEKTELLGEIHSAEQALPQFMALLDEFELIEPFTLDVTLKDGSQGRLAGLYVIAEEKLYNLGDEAVSKLHKANALLPIFMAVASFSQFGSLVERRNRQLESS
ncbi:SapC family protein [Parvularcula lutaonensis]|uniref:SapC family protein n=1 Tax=Parvularcula lutaonensis TaxID=491923 RepID=A0ABV7MBQ6_9PROT|nr:SapC family protein [Parvularcula lutaonensis]GGY37903.1 peptidase [Parvularcula lutaonensis]